MNNKGFTMIELLASMVLLSILMLVAVPTVLNMMDQTRRKTVINDAGKFVSAVEYKLKNNNNYIKKPRANGECIVITLGYLDLGNEFNEGPHGGIYSLDDSYVIVQYDTSNSPTTGPRKYKFYVTLVENYKGETYYGLFLYPYDKLTNKGSDAYVDGFKKSNLLSTVISAPDTKLKGSRITNFDNKTVGGANGICAATTFNNISGNAERGTNDKVYDTDDALNEVNAEAK